MHQSSDQVGLSLSAFSGLNDAGATPTSDHTDQPQPQSSSLSAYQQQQEEGTTIPNYVLISKPGSLLNTQHQAKNVSSTTPFHLVTFPMTYSNSVDMFYEIHPTHLSNMNYLLAQLFVPLPCTGSTPSQMLFCHAQRPNDTSLDEVFMPASIPHFLGLSSVCTHTAASFSSVSSVQGLYSLFQN